MSQNYSNDEINYIDFFNLINRRKVFIIVITFLITGLVYVLDITFLNKASEQDKIVFNGKVTLELGYISYLPNVDTEIDTADEIIKMAFRKIVYIEDPRITINKILNNNKNIKITYSYDRINKIVTSNPILNYSSSNKNELKEKIQQVINTFLDSEKFLTKLDKESKFKVHPPKISNEIYSSKTFPAKVKKTLTMKLIVSFVMGIIFALIAAVFLDRIKNNINRVNKGK